jgi:LruC domain-containing protein
MKYFIALFLLPLIFSSCTKYQNTPSSPTQITAFEELVISNDFSWTSSNSGPLYVRFQNPEGYGYNLNSQYVHIVSVDGTSIAKSMIQNRQARFDVSLPAILEGYSIYRPATDQKWPLTQMGTIDLELRNFRDTNVFANKSELTHFNKQMSSALFGSNLLGNADFEIDDFPAADGSMNPNYVDDGKWHVYSNGYTWNTENGSKVIKAKKNKYAEAWQWISVSPGDSISVVADFSGQVYSFINYYGDYSTDDIVGNAWHDLTSDPSGIVGIVPNGTLFAEVSFYFTDHAWIDNAYAGTKTAVIDADADGVEDSQDAFPNNPNLAYIVNYPNAGSRTLAFEDLWPAMGDYDFNDMVVNSKMTIYQNAQLEWISADVEVSLDAMGAGISNGLAIRLVDANHLGLPSDIINSVSGDASLDPDVMNGIIVFNNPSEIQSSYYSNTEDGSMRTPDTARFTITFGMNGGVYFLPDMYIFRSDERGREVHLPGYYGTAAADVSLYNTADDHNGTYRTENGLPWAMELVLDNENFKHPKEKVDIIQAYTNFSLWAISEGGSNNDWYLLHNESVTVDLNQ